jgi:hypothetical protein|tara:strand:+ start:637 stop:1851 length:1215 start_codon:yes stop_codon:yes gene_type:complete
MAKRADWKNWADAYETIPNFEATKFERQKNPNGGPWYADGSDNYAELQKMVLYFTHVPSNTVVSFKAFITAFNESYISNWSSEEVYGRADPLYLFKNTTRKITLAFKVPAASQGEAFQNLGRVQKLVQFLYPNYSTVDGAIGAQTISQSPVVRMKVLNLAQSHAHGTLTVDPRSGASAVRPGMANVGTGVGGSAAEVGPSYPSFTYDQVMSGLGEQSPEFGLLGVIDNLVVNHNLEGDDGAFEQGKGVILPKFIDINLSFSAIHEHPVGWEEDPTFAGGSRFITPSFPYSVDVEGSLPQVGEFGEPLGWGIDPDVVAASQLDPEGQLITLAAGVHADVEAGQEVNAAEVAADFNKVITTLYAAEGSDLLQAGAESLGYETAAQAESENFGLGTKEEGELPVWDD